MYDFGFPVVSDNVAVQLRYIDLRLAGEGHKMAEVLATRKFPGVRGTDAVFMEGRNSGDQFDDEPELGARYRRQAEAAGVSIAGKHYLSGLAAFPGDPEAWVSGLSDVRRVCEARGLGCEGAVSVEAPPRSDPGPPVPIDPRLVDREVAARIAAEPELADRRRDLVEEVTALRSGAIDPMTESD